MRILIINVTCGIGSTGRICTDLATNFDSQGHIVKIAYGRGKVPQSFRKYAVKIGNKLDIILHGLATRLLDLHGFGSKTATKEFLEWAEQYNPDLLWLHNIHGYYINVEQLFFWIKSRPQMKVKWTLHDCWSFTGHCVHFSVAKCEKWKDHCEKCIQKRTYPGSYILDNSKNNYERKKNAFIGVKDLTLITPSQWLANLVRQSFLKAYHLEVNYNSVNMSIFKPTVSSFREKYNLKRQNIILGVANTWSPSKGLDDFIKLSSMLDQSYTIVLVGLSNQQIKQIPNNILGIKRTNNPAELASIYTTADVFVNPSKEETFGMTTLEALCCGTKAIVYKNTACEEIANRYGGIVVEQDVEALKNAILKLKIECNCN